MKQEDIVKKFKGNISELKKIISEEILFSPKGKEECEEFIEALQNSFNDIQDFYQTRVSSLNETICILENEIHEEPEWIEFETERGLVCFMCDNLEHQNLLEDFIQNKLP